MNTYPYLNFNTFDRRFNIEHKPMILIMYRQYCFQLNHTPIYVTNL